MERESPASAGLSRVLLVMTLLLGGCAVGGGGGSEDEAARPERLAEEAQPLVQADAGEVAGVPSSVPAGGPTATNARSGSATTSTARPSSSGGGSGAGAVTTTTTLRPFHEVAAVGDRTGDAGLQARPYGDLTRLTVEDDGTQARVTVEVAGALPAQPAEGEVMGFGVDVYRGSEESDFQLFGQGNADGWRAWLQEADGDFVDYPGTFHLGGNRLVFTVPWSSLGGRRPGSLSAFADWSQARVAVVADESSDRAPDGRATHPFSP